MTLILEPVPIGAELLKVLPDGLTTDSVAPVGTETLLESVDTVFSLLAGSSPVIVLPEMEYTVLWIEPVTTSESPPPPPPPPPPPLVVVGTVVVAAVVSVGKVVDTGAVKVGMTAGR